MAPFYPGIDLHLKRTFMVLMNANGEVIDKQHISNQEMKPPRSKLRGIL
ncbi:MAG: hypothetical protein MUO42_06285 [Anaerolineaceae bacterium]|nr:hypothetical protein [Anaerolineaceae bacterium]